MRRTIIQTLTLLTIVLLTSQSGLADSNIFGNIMGYAVDAESRSPLAGLNVVIEGTRRGAATDTEGKFNIEQLAPRKYTIIASMIGYETVVKEIEVLPEQIVTLNFRMFEDPLSLPAVVITATRTQRYVKDVPFRTEVITNKELKEKSAHNLYDALDGTPGLRVEQQCQACNFSVLRMQGLGADHTQVLLDGQPVYSGLASVYGLQQLSVADIDRIEIVKGAGSALYGSHAIAGAINIITTKPAATKATVGVEIGQYNTNRYDFTADMKKRNIGIFVFGQQNQGNIIDETGDGLGRDEVNKPDGISDRVKTNTKNFGFNIFVDDVFQSDELSIRGRLMNEQRQGGELSDQMFENPFTPGTEQIITDRYNVDFGYRKWFTKGNEIGFRVSYTNHKRNATNDTFLNDYEAVHGVLPPVEILRPYIADEKLTVFSVNYSHPLGEKHRLLSGVEYSHNELNESGKYVDASTGVDYTSSSEKHADEIGVYLQDEFRINKRTEIVIGMRFDHHRSEDNFRSSETLTPGGFEPVNYDESTVNPRFAIRYNSSDKLTLRGNFGTGHRVPYGFSEDLHLCSGSPRVYKGADLEPEKSVSFGVSADYRIRKMNLNVNLYRTDLKNAISFAESDNDIKALGYDYQWENVDDGFVQGIELDAKYALTRNLKISANFAYNQAEYLHEREDWVGTVFEEDSKHISRYPITAGGLRIEYAPKTWIIVLDGDYTGKMFIDYMSEDDPLASKIHKTEPFIILNAQISKGFNDQIKLYFGVKNLNDCLQKEKHTDDAAFLYAPVFGRIVYGGIRVSLE